MSHTGKGKESRGERKEAWTRTGRKNTPWSDAKGNNRGKGGNRGKGSGRGRGSGSGEWRGGPSAYDVTKPEYEILRRKLALPDEPPVRDYVKELSEGDLEKAQRREEFEEMLQVLNGKAPPYTYPYNQVCFKKAGEIVRSAIEALSRPDERSEAEREAIRVRAGNDVYSALLSSKELLSTIEYGCYDVALELLLTSLGTTRGEAVAIDEQTRAHDFFMVRGRILRPGMECTIAGPMISGRRRAKEAFYCYVLEAIAHYMKEGKMGMTRGVISLGNVTDECLAEKYTAYDERLKDVLRDFNTKHEELCNHTPLAMRGRAALQLLAHEEAENWIRESYGTEFVPNKASLLLAAATAMSKLGPGTYGLEEKDEIDHMAVVGRLWAQSSSLGSFKEALLDTYPHALTPPSVFCAMSDGITKTNSEE